MIKRDRLIDIKLKDVVIDVTGHRLGSLYYRVSPRNWSKWNPLHWFSMIWGFEPVWVIERCTVDEYGNPLGYGVAKMYEHRINDLKTVGDLLDFIDKFEEKYISSHKHHVRKEEQEHE